MPSASVPPPGPAGPVIAERYWRFAWVLATVCYAVLLIDGATVFDLPRPPLDLTFNTMLEHLLRGRFDVDPGIVGNEGFARGGQVYAYWGIFPALLRLPLTVLPGWQQIDLTALSCLMATALALAAKLWTLRRIVLARPDMPRWMAGAMIAVLALSGAQTSFLRPSIYQEVCSWSGTFGAVFVAAAIAGQIDGFSRGPLLAMALACGGALLTRASMAVGLVAAFGLLFVVLAVRSRGAPRSFARRLALPLAVLALALVATGYVNFERWGNPLTFADYSYHKMNAFYPDRVERTARYGLFNLARVPFGLVYYFFPVWAFRGGDGALILSSVRDRLIDSAELPPMSFLLTDPLLLLLAGAALMAWRRASNHWRIEGCAIALGLAVAPLLMLAAISMCFRYRIDFYPLIEFLAFAGLAMSPRPALFRRPLLVGMLAVIGIVGSHVALLLYDLSQNGPAQVHISRPGLGQYYAGRAARSHR